MGPPCGTASKARNIPIKRKLRKKGAPNPQPLRSSLHPLGFPWLKGLNKVKVEAANALYECSSRLAKLCNDFSVLFTIENPANSLMWETPFFRGLVSKFHFHVIDVATAILANFSAPRLRQRCMGNHKHAAWKIQQSQTGEWSFDTAKEAEYPVRLASEIASAFLEELSSRGDIHLVDDVCDHAVKISAVSQPRRTRGPLLLSEFKSKVSVSCAYSDQPPEFITESVAPPWQGIPVGSKRIDIKPVDGRNGCEGQLNVVYGVYFSPEEFIQKVQGIRHPFDVPLPLDEANMESIRFIFEKGPAKVASFRAERLSHYLKRAKSLQRDEMALHKSLNKDCQLVLESKRLLLFREMLDDAGVKDEYLFQDLCSGFRLVGDINASGQFTQQFKPAILGVEQLRQTAVWAQKAVVSSCKMILEDMEVAQAVWEETMEQASPEKGWVLGPFSANEISERLGPNWIPSRRFGVRQGGKIRPVDDFSQFLINSSVTCHEKIDLEGIDHICATARFFLGAPGGEGRFFIPGGTGVSVFDMAPAWSSAHSGDLFGRCLDLKQAYKQLVRHPDDSWASVLAVTNPKDGQIYFFEAVALPFGSVSSVLAFNRAARALRLILTKVFKLVVTNFFDDFCQLELGLLRNSAWMTAESVMSLLGWKISVGEDKRKPFSKTFEILGAVIKLPESESKVVEVYNKESRLLRLKEQMEELRQSLGVHIGRSKIEPLKGRLLYAAGHTYGRCTQLACQLLHRFGGSGPTCLVTPELVHATAEALETLLDSKPRAIQAWNDCPPLLLFTDGAVEENSNLVTHGAVLIDPWKQRSLFFGDHVPEPFVNLWKSSGKRQVIAQAEIFPVLVSKDTWKDHLFGRSILWFLDNDAARAALIRNFSPVMDNFFLLQLNAKMDTSIQARNWYNRVPSTSNPSDDASRLEFGTYRNSEQCRPCYSTVLHEIDRFRKLKQKFEMGG
jgi:hypothetical protein